jgi:hypothetical protein
MCQQNQSIKGVHILALAIIIKFAELELVAETMLDNGFVAPKNIDTSPRVSRGRLRNFFLGVPSPMYFEAKL